MNCHDCKHYEPLGTEDSGLMLPDRSAPWVYKIGRCNNAKSVHGGWQPIGAPTPPRNNLPEWVKCEHWKARKVAKQD